jgi:hypothetical protein
MSVFGCSFQRTFFVFAVVGMSNWSFWLPAGLPASPAHISTQRRFVELPSAKPAIRMPASAVAKSSARTSVLAANDSNTNVHVTHDGTAGVNALHLPSSGPDAPILSPLQPEPNDKSKSDALVWVGALSPGFLENRGQFDEHVKFALRGHGKTVWLTENGLVFDVLRDISDGKNKQLRPTDTSVNSQVPLGALPSKNASVTQTKERLVFNEDFLNANAISKIEAGDLQQGAYNFISGNDPAKWQVHVQAYGEVVYHDMWEGIDVRVRRNGTTLEQEFIVRPGGDLSRVQIAYRGIDGLSISPDGLLEIQTKFGKLQETRPRIYQEIAGNRIEVDGRFKLLSESAYTFDVSAHRENYTLVIDPTLQYSTFLGGSAGNDIYTTGNQEVATGIGVDASGDAYVAGYTASTDFPTTPGAFQVSPPSGSFITKLDPTGASLLYSTYLGNSDSIQAIAVDSTGNAYVTGYTAPTFPTTPNAFWPTNSNQSCTSADFFVTELNSSGNQLLYSSCFNVSTNLLAYGYYPRAIAADNHGRVFVAGGAGDGLPTTTNAYQPIFPGGSSAFVSVFDTTISGSSSLIYSTYIGPANRSSNALAYGIAVDPFGKVYVAGSTLPGFPVTLGAYQTDYPPCIPNGNLCTPSGASFVAKVDPSTPGSPSLIYSTYFGGLGSTNIYAIAVDSSGSVYLTGGTSGSYYQTFPITPGALQATAGQNVTASFVTKLNPAGSGLVYSTFVSDQRLSIGYAIAVDVLGDAYVVGQVNGSTFPVTTDAFQTTYIKQGGNTDYASAFIAKLNAIGSALLYSSYLGGAQDDVATAVTVDQAGDAYVAGRTSSSNFPVTTGVFQPVMDGTGDAFVTKFPLQTNQSFSISSLTPSIGGNTGTVTMSILGAGFHSGATVRLEGATTVPAVTVVVGYLGSTIGATFDLTSAPVGAYAVVITNPGGSTTSMPNAFLVQQGGAPSLSLSIVGLDVMRPSIPYEYDVVYHNTGNVDAYLVPVWIEVPGNLSWKIIPELAPPPTTNASIPIDLTQVPPQIVNSSNNTVIPLLVPKISAGSGGIIRVMVTVAASLTYHPATIATWITEPWITNASQLVALPMVTLSEPSFLQQASMNIPSGFNVDAFNCITAFGNLIVSALGQNATCVQKIAAAGISTAEGIVGLVYSNQLPGDTIFSITQLIWSWTKPALIDCGLATVEDATGYAEIISFFNGVDAVFSKTGVIAACAGCLEPLAESILTVEIGASSDPNNKTGILGVGSQHWVAGTEPLVYGVFFENDASATVPAQTVTITDPLALGIDDLTTFSFDSIALGNQLFLIPEGTTYSTMLDLRPQNNLLVGVNGVMNPSLGQVIWTFTSIDPATGNPTTDPTAGFLPPGGSGSVFFRITPMPAVATGTAVNNQATIVFDANTPISTSTWINTIDDSAPSSHVISLPPTEGPTGFSVSWSGSDAGAGIRGFTIYVSDNGAPFAPWQTNTTATSATFTGQLGDTYSFYSIAQDLVGNVEPAKTVPEATTEVILTTDTTPPVTLALASPSPNGNGWNNTNVVVTLNSTDAGPGASGVEQVTYSVTGAQGIGSTVVPGASTSFTVSTEGTTTITFFGTDNAGNIEAPKTITVRIDKTPPSILGSRTPPANANGWNNSNMTVSFTCSDSISGLAAGSPPASTVLSTEGAGESVAGACQDLAGNSAVATVGGINIDKTPPILTASVNPPPNANGWNNSPTTVSFAAADSLSGVALVSAPVTVSVDGAGQIVTGSATDLAGNVTSGSVTINLDQTPPEAFVQFDPSNKDILLFGRDSLSGVAPGPVAPISVQPVPDTDHSEHDADRGINRDGKKTNDRRAELRTYQFLDLAGNSLLLVVEVGRHEESETVRLLKLLYNGRAVLNLARNEATFEWEYDQDGTLSELRQTLNEFEGENSLKWDATYESRRGATTIEQESPGQKQKIIVPGLDLLQITTSNGQLLIDH